MSVIWKYELPLTDMPVVKMQEGAKVLSVAVQFNRLCVWALVDSEVGTEDRVFWVIGTGNHFDADMSEAEFIGTIMVDGGQLVFHIFTRR